MNTNHINNTGGPVLPRRIRTKELKFFRGELYGMGRISKAQLRWAAALIDRGIFEQKMAFAMGGRPMPSMAFALMDFRTDEVTLKLIDRLEVHLLREKHSISVEEALAMIADHDPSTDETWNTVKNMGDYASRN